MCFLSNGKRFVYTILTDFQARLLLLLSTRVTMNAITRANARAIRRNAMTGFDPVSGGVGIVVADGIP